MSEPRARGWQWTQADDDQLRAMLEAGMKATEIAPKLETHSMRERKCSKGSGCCPIVTDDPSCFSPVQLDNL